MTGNGTTRGHAIPHTIAAASPAAEGVQADRDALPEGTTPAEKAEIVRRLITRHAHGAEHALLGEPPGRVLGARICLPAWRWQVARHLILVVCSDNQRRGAWHVACPAQVEGILQAAW
jgi:hypothetical protein